MIVGAHVLLYTTNPDADRAFVRDVLGFRGVDAGGGWMIFALPSGGVLGLYQPTHSTAI